MNVLILHRELINASSGSGLAFRVFSLFQVAVIMEGIGPQWSSKWILALGCIILIGAQ